jgi:acyl-coenzyme A synthetase/AMP-(fatty) acid ligase
MTNKANIADFLPEMAARQPDAAAIICPWGRRGRRLVPVLVDPGIGLKHLKACLGNAEPEAFIGVPKAHAARVILGWGRATIRTNVTVGRRWFWGGHSLAKVEMRGSSVSSRDSVSTSPEDMAAIVFTSGSTGPPKGVIYKHGNFIAQVNAIRDEYGIEPGEVNLPTFPLFALFDPALGMTTIVPDMDPTRPAKVDPRKIISPIEEYGVTTMFGSPALLDTVGRWGEEHGVTLPSLKRVISAGAPVSPKVIERVQSMLTGDAAIHTPYGATESLPVATISSHEILAETRHATDRGAGTCVGRPVDSIEAAVIRIDDEPISTWSEDLTVDDGEIGEIVVKGPQVSRAYHNAPAHDRLAKITDGETIRHRMGDLGFFDDRGRLWFCGRKTHRVETKDGTLYTVPCESVFNAHPEVFRTALVGVGTVGAQRPVLCVELEAGVSATEESRILEELLALGAGFEHTEQIQTILFHPGFPVDIRHNAKIGRSVLADWATKRLAS